MISGVNSKRVDNIDQKYLCTGCGACSAICPSGAISMTLTKEGFRPMVDRTKCINCGKCFETCTGRGIFVDKISKKFWPENKKNKLVGKYSEIYLGYSNDESVRYNAASGGITTIILIYLLEKKIIDGAIVTKFNEKEMEPRTFIARSRKEIISAQTSLYCPTCPVATIKETKRHTGEKFAFVGLPCHIHALKTLAEREHWIHERIKLSIGLFCSRGATLDATKVILKKFAKGTDGIRSLKYRGNGWPGTFSVEYADRKIFKVPLYEYWPRVFAPFFYVPYRCLSCHDMSAELADISVGDAWLKRIKEKDKKGTSIIVARSSFGVSILKTMKKENFITLSKIKVSKVIDSQKGALLRKKVGVGSRLKLLHILGKPIPQYDIRFKHSLGGLLGAALAWLLSFISKTKTGAILIEKSPRILTETYLNLVYKYSIK